MRKILTLCMLILGLGCRNEIKVHTKDMAINNKELHEPSIDNKNEDPEKSAEIPEPEFSGEFAFARSWVQSRSVLKLKLSKDLVAYGEPFTLTNETTSKVIFDSSTMALALADGGDAANYYFYLNDPDTRGNFSYGKNNIRLDILNEDEPRYATAMVTLRDFSIFAPVMTHFGEDVQVMSTVNGGTFQGWLNVVSQPLVATETSVLTTGMGTIINQ